LEERFGAGPVRFLAAMNAIKVSTQHKAHRAVVTLVGEHEGYAAQKLERELADLLDEGLHVEFDLRNALFIDSQVAAVMVAARKRADAEHVQLDVTVGDETGWSVLRLLDVTGLASFLGVVRR
jgi:anti-anti-sigma factor